MGGSDDPSNIVELTTEEHALAHKKLYEEHGKKHDYVAWKALSGCIGKEEIHRIMTVHYGKDNGNYGMGYKQAGEKNPFWGKKHTEKNKRRASVLNSGEFNPNFGGVQQTFEVRKDMSEKKKGSKNNQWGKHWYTNGVEEKCVYEVDKPDGWYRGRNY